MSVRELQLCMTHIKNRLLRELRRSEEPLDYRSLIEHTRLPGTEIAKGLEILEREGSVLRQPDTDGFRWIVNR